MKITENFLTPNKYSRPQIPLEKVTKIAVHYVGNANTSAANNRSYFEGLKDQIPDKTGKWRLNPDGTFFLYKGNKVEIAFRSSHFLIGMQGEIIQCLPLNEWSYCTNWANGYSISIECCHPDSTGKFNAATEQSLAELCAYLLEKFGLGVDDIIRHYDVTKKQCPLYWSPTKYQSAEIANARFKAFKDKVAVLMKKDKPVDTSINTDKSFLVQVLDSALNIRKYPSITAPIVGVITDKKKYTIVAQQYGGNILWGKLKSGAGWISLGSKYVKKV